MYLLFLLIFLINLILYFLLDHQAHQRPRLVIGKLAGTVVDVGVALRPGSLGAIVPEVHREQMVRRGLAEVLHIVALVR